MVPQQLTLYHRRPRVRAVRSAQLPEVARLPQRELRPLDLLGWMAQCAIGVQHELTLEAAQKVDTPAPQFFEPFRAASVPRAAWLERDRRLEPRPLPPQPELLLRLAAPPLLLRRPSERQLRSFHAEPHHVLAPLLWSSRQPPPPLLRGWPAQKEQLPVPHVQLGEVPPLDWPCEPQKHRVLENHVAHRRGDVRVRWPILRRRRVGEEVRELVPQGVL